MSEMSAADREVLDFELTWWGHSNAKESAVLKTFGHSLTRYHQRLNRLLDSPSVVAVAPMEVRLLQARRAASVGRRVGRVRD